MQLQLQQSVVILLAEVLVLCNDTTVVVLPE